MTAILDRAAFFARIRRDPFPGHLTPGQVSGMEAILDACPPDWPTDWLAYALGTCPIETGWTMRPIAEKGGAAYFTRMYDIRGNRPAKARELGNLTPGDGARFRGRGYVQLTGRANYRTLTARLRGLGSLTRAQDLEATPDLALQPDLAAAILFVGMSEGLFTGRRLASYFGAGKADWIGARRIINGQDRAAEIARHAQAFRAALVAAGHRPGAVTPAMPVQPVEADPLPEPAATVAAPPSMPAPPAAQGWWAWLAGLFGHAAPAGNPSRAFLSANALEPANEPRRPIMTTAQIASLLRTILMIGGGFAVGQGWVAQEHVDAITDPALLLQIVGGLVAVGTALYAIAQRSPKKMIEATAALSEVEKIVAPGLADAIPDRKVSAS